MALTLKIITSLSSLNKAQWQALLPDDNPFYQYDFLNNLEVHNCVGNNFGWLPRHLALFDGKKLVSVLILYEKHNNYGEFVFDQAWHQAYQQNQLPYYPKLVCAIPYTPITCVKILSLPEYQNYENKLIEQAKQFAIKQKMSGLHFLFCPETMQKNLLSQGFMQRIDCQFHWHNQQYEKFEDFLAKLSAKKRKNIRQERKKITQSGVVIRPLDGDSATAQDWRNFDKFYQRTFMEKSGTPTLNLGFFQDIAAAMPKQILLVLADLDEKCIAGSLMFASQTTLYGRHWGCVEQVDYLHFELCYYQGIEYCIKHNLQTFEPGAGGEHKIARGFLPKQTQSAHFLTKDYFKQAIEDFCVRETIGVNQYIEKLSEKSPYKES